MFRKLMMIGLLAACLSATSQAFAEDVYVTPKGSKYHKEDCRLIRNKENMIKMDKKGALEEGYEPCRRCYKEDVDVEEKKKGDN